MSNASPGFRRCRGVNWGATVFVAVLLISVIASSQDLSLNNSNEPTSSRPTVIFYPEYRSFEGNLPHGEPFIIQAELRQPHHSLELRFWRLERAVDTCASNTKAKKRARVVSGVPMPIGTSPATKFRFPIGRLWLDAQYCFETRGKRPFNAEEVKGIKTSITRLLAFGEKNPVTDEKFREFLGAYSDYTLQQPGGKQTTVFERIKATFTNDLNDDYYDALDGFRDATDDFSSARDAVRDAANNHLAWKESVQRNSDLIKEVIGVDFSKVHSNLKELLQKEPDELTTVLLKDPKNKVFKLKQTIVDACGSRFTQAGGICAAPEGAAHKLKVTLDKLEGDLSSLSVDIASGGQNKESLFKTLKESIGGLSDRLSSDNVRLSNEWKRQHSYAQQASSLINTLITAHNELLIAMSAGDLPSDSDTLPESIPDGVGPLRTAADEAYKAARSFIGGGCGNKGERWGPMCEQINGGVSHQSRNILDSFIGKWEAIEDIHQARKAIDATITAFKGDLTSLDVGSSETSADFTQRAAWYISGDVGVIAPVFNTSSADLALFVGINFYFEPVDKNVPLSAPGADTFGKRFSLVGGITLTDIEDPDKTISPALDTAFLVAGAGYRMTDYVRAGAGLVFFDQKSPNPASNNENLRFAFYTSLSIDIDVVGTVKGIFTRGRTEAGQ